MAKWQFTKGLHDIGNGCHAYLQPDGGWGWSNAGLITDGDRSLLVDTLFDLKLTREMLGAMRDAVPAAKSIGTLVNTHSNGDHTFGNQLLGGAEVHLPQDGRRLGGQHQGAVHDRRQHHTFAAGNCAADDELVLVPIVEIESDQTEAWFKLTTSTTATT